MARVEHGVAYALLPAGIEALFRFLPVHYVPPGRDVFRPAVLIFQIIGVLPNIQTDHWKLAFHDGGILIGGGKDIELAAIFHEPSPAGSEPRGCCRPELFFEGGKTAERAVDGRRQVPGWLSASLGTDDGPEHGVIDVSAAVIADRSPDGFGNDAAVVSEQLLDRLVRQVGRGFQRLV